MAKLKKGAQEEATLEQSQVIFGGTGAIGGQIVIEMIELYEKMLSIGKKEASTVHIIATGKGPNDIAYFMEKLTQAFQKKGKDTFTRETDSLSNGKDLIILKRESGIQLELCEFDARPVFKQGLETVIRPEVSREENLNLLQKAIFDISSPFEEFLFQYKKRKNLSDDFRFCGVLSGIPIPSVAAYHMNAIDKILDQLGIERDTNRKVERSIKAKILEAVAQGLGNIKKFYAQEVLIAHTTSVGGMFTIVNGNPVIHLGYAHSSLGELLKEKQFYANALTETYSKLGLKTLITAAAVGINNISAFRQLPMSNNVRIAFSQAQEKDNLPISPSLLQSASPSNQVFPSFQLSLQASDKNQKNSFESTGPLNVNFALESGENGFFSIDNTWALYLNMKVSMQEELAHILAFNALFGDDLQRPWFDQHGICYREESDNSILIFALLGNNAQFTRYQLSGFTAKAFQDLGSSKHQAELHTTGLYTLLHRLGTLDLGRIAEVTCKYRVEEVMEFVDKNSQPLLLEDIIDYNSQDIEKKFTKLLSISTPQEMANFVGYKTDLSLQKGFVETFFCELLNAVKKTINTITSLGTPIIYRDQEGQEKILVGPYVAPADLVISHTNTFYEHIEKISQEHSLAQQDLWDWLVTNNGFVDLRAQATIVRAKSYKENLSEQITRCQSSSEFREALNALPLGSYFTSSGVLAFTQRLTGLYEQLSSFNIHLGTYNKWKALFPINSSGNHPVLPGVVEAMRMYSEGLGKITGTELLYPGYGYFE